MNFVKWKLILKSFLLKPARRHNAFRFDDCLNLMVHDTGHSVVTQQLWLYLKGVHQRAVGQFGLQLCLLPLHVMSADSTQPRDCSNASARPPWPSPSRGQCPRWVGPGRCLLQLLRWHHIVTGNDGATIRGAAHCCLHANSASHPNCRTRTDSAAASHRSPLCINNTQPSQLQFFTSSRNSNSLS